MCIKDTMRIDLMLKEYERFTKLDEGTCVSPTKGHAFLIYNLIVKLDTLNWYAYLLTVLCAKFGISKYFYIIVRRHIT